MSISRKCLKARRVQREGRKPIADAYYGGDAAWHQGEGLETNPHEAGTESHKDWSDGWLDAAAGK